MFQSLKRFWPVLMLLLGGAQGVFGFALLGPPNEAYQVPTIGYNVTTIAFALGDVFTVDVGAPKNFQQGYRWNTPTNYYAFDASFVTFYGPKGMAAVDQAFALYNSLSNVSSYSADLSEWPYKASRVNFGAQAVGLLDVKSMTLQLMIEQLGLASPDRYTWGLHDRFQVPGAPCFDDNYIVIKRNFDPATLTNSSYVNNQLLGYTIIDVCSLNPNPFAPFVADAAEYTTDPKGALTAVASQALNVGEFFTGFTRDDIGGLRDLYSPTNVFGEAASSNSFQLVTNTQASLLTTFNLAIFESQALTNDAAALSLLYPGLIITSTTNFFTNVITTNFNFFLQSIVGDTAGRVTIGVTTTLTTNTQSLFAHTFANLVILHTGGPATETIQQTSVTEQHVPGTSPGSITISTNIVSTVITLPFTNGDFYIQAANMCGPFQILGVQRMDLVSITNPIPIISAGLGAVPQFFIANIVQTFTNFTYLVKEVDCGTNTVALRQGIGKITFIRRDFDGLLGTIWDPVTNFYNLTAVTNSAMVQTFRRVITQPDILFTTSDLTSGPAAAPAVSAISRTIPSFNSGVATAAGQPGPGTIEPRVVLTFNNVGPAFFNNGPFFLNNSGVTLGTIFEGSSDTNETPSFQWGSFDGTTNELVVYPSTLSLASLQSQIYFQVITPLPLPTGQVGLVYNPNGISPGVNGVQLQASGGTTNSNGGYTWLANPIGLPPGLRLSTAGIISGTPTQAGSNYVFTAQAMDAGQRVTSAVLNINVNP